MQGPKNKDEQAETEALDDGGDLPPDYDPDATAVLEDHEQEVDISKLKRK